jgi:acyl-CoA thioester hydrolase
MMNQDKYKVKVRFEVPWGDMDVLGHINNTKIVKYFEAARIKYLDLLNLTDPSKNLGIGIILSDLNVQFIQPIVYPSVVIATASVSEINDDKILLEYFLFIENVGIAAIGQSNMVIYNYFKNIKIAIPDSIIEKINQIESQTT